MKKIAAIDMGTNSFLCLIAEVSGSKLKVIEDHVKVVRLGEKVNQNKFFLPQALARAQDCLKEFKKIIERNKVDKVIATATSAARDAKNGNELKRICDELSIPLFIIEGEKEAQLSFKGAVSNIENFENKKILVVDVGGGSTEFIFSEPGKKLKAISFDVGCVRLTEMFLSKDPIDERELFELRKYAQRAISNYGHINPDVIIAVAGTPTTLACVEQKIDFNESKVEGFKLTQNKLFNLLQNLSALSLDERKNIIGLEPLRADVIIAGIVLLQLALELAAKDEMVVSTRGLRYGVALNHASF
ncbi:MAG: Ppx/GppA family phosphatase [Oligoflexia bacterium]|nr:Ppx/GppA family phosphatase [Oligoflexia bacterium]